METGEPLLLILSVHGLLQILLWWRRCAGLSRGGACLHRLRALVMHIISHGSAHTDLRIAPAPARAVNAARTFPSKCHETMPSARNSQVQMLRATCKEVAVAVADGAVAGAIGCDDGCTGGPAAG